MKSTVLRMISVILISTFMVTLLAGCFSSESNTDNSGPQVLRILGGWGDDNYLRQEWIDHFELSKGNVEIEVIPLEEPYNPNQGEEEREDPQERLKRLLTEGIPPDVILLDGDIYRLNFLVEEGLVQPLETFMENSKFDVNRLVPAIREGIKSAGDGTSMYALAPMFSSQALYYNKDLFDRHGVPYPTDNMTWTQIADLAKQFPKGEGEDKIYGLWTDYGNPSIYEFLNSYAAPLELQLFDQDVQNVTMNTPEWESALSEYISLYTDEVFSRRPEYNPDGEWNPEMDYYWDAFYRGKAAMAISGAYEISNFSNRRMYDTETEAFDWDVVTVPTHASAPGIGGSINYRGLMAINRNSQNANLAWEFISFNNSEAMLKIKSRNQGQFVSVEELNQFSADGPSNMQAFFALTPAVDTMSAMYRGSNNEKLWQVFSLADQKMQEVVKGEKTVQEAIDEIQTQGQEILESETEEPPVNTFR